MSDRAEHHPAKVFLNRISPAVYGNLHLRGACVALSPTRADTISSRRTLYSPELVVTTVETFREYFDSLTGNPPFPWQEKLYEEWLSLGRIPRCCNIPTGLG